MNTPLAGDSPLRLVRIGWVTLTDEGIITSADHAARTILTHDAALEGQLLRELVKPQSAEDFAALSSRPPYTWLGASSEGAPLLVHVSRLGTLPGLVATITSINEYLAESQALARVQLRNTVESIIAGFAHEVRNPLAAILSLTEAALQQEPAPDSVLVRIPGLVARVESLIKHSLAYSRPKPPRRQLHQVDFVIERAMSLLRPRDTVVRLELDDIDEDLPPVMVDLHQAEQVLVNLLENALDAARSQVSVSVKEGNTSVGSICLSVIDDGPGVAPEVAPRVFDPFFTTKAHGTGLGLAIARDLARLNGGDLRLASQTKTTFELYLPSTTSPVRGHW